MKKPRYGVCITGPEFDGGAIRVTSSQIHAMGFESIQEFMLQLSKEKPQLQVIPFELRMQNRAEKNDSSAA